MIIEGWECPKCSKIHSPDVRACVRCKGQPLKEVKGIPGIMRAHRIARKIDQGTIASCLDKSRTSITNIELGRQRVSVVLLEDYCLLFGEEFVTDVCAHLRSIAGGKKRADLALSEIELEQPTNG